MMELLTNEALAQLEKEVEAAMESPDARASIAGIDSDFLCKNKEAIMNFIKMIADLIPGVLGKIVGMALIKAAEMWFKRHCS
ncbi:MAG: hypothetical protein RL839_08765 [Gammaproteobacteria bacterium]